jgi:hypothetical protein
MADLVICQAPFYNCFCTEQVGHADIHKCDCGGSWDHDGKVMSFPIIGTGPFIAIQDLGRE